jgi:beta-lactam-binding protein with PASTA domain
VFKTLTSKPLWVNVAAGIVLLLLLLFLFLASLAILTRHGKTMKIPSVTGMSYADAKKSLEFQGFDVKIQDSVYNDTMPPLQVIKQYPESDELVKVNRTIFLTINQAQAPFISMPNLVSMTFRTANMILHQYGLKLEDTVFKPDFARNSVLQMLYKGDNIKPGTQIQQGSGITLVLGSGIGGEAFAVPDLFGMTYQEARARLDSMGLALGSVNRDPDVKDTTGVFVYKQVPTQFNDDKKLNAIHAGQTIDIRLGTEATLRRMDSIRNAATSPPADPVAPGTN